MATKVALTAEEFRENSQRSIALFNTEKLSTNSTHVLKSAYCNSVHFCRCNLHGACGGKAFGWLSQNQKLMLQSARSVWRQRRRTMCGGIMPSRCNLHGACGGKGRLRLRRCLRRCRCNLHGACGGKDDALYAEGADPNGCNLHGACGGKVHELNHALRSPRCNLHGACGGKGP